MLSWLKENPWIINHHILFTAAQCSYGVLHSPDGHALIHSKNFTKHSCADCFLVADNTAGNYADGVPVLIVPTLQGKGHKQINTDHIATQLSWW